MVFIILWQLSPLFLDLRAQTPLPLDTAVAFWDLLSSGSLVIGGGISLLRVLAGFTVAAVIAVSLGLLMGVNPFIERQLSPLIESFRPIAPVALLPLAILWFGSGTPAAVFLIAWAAFFPLLVNTIAGVRETDKNLIQSAKTMGVNNWNIVLRVVFPAALPRIIVGARIALGIAWAAVIAAELAVSAKAGDGSSGGLGQMMYIFYAFSSEINAIVAAMIMVGLIGLSIDAVLRWFSRKIVVWRDL